MINGIPKTEKVWLTKKTSKGETYYITSKETRDCYYLYKLENGKAVKIAKGDNPSALEEKYIKD